MDGSPQGRIPAVEPLLGQVPDHVRDQVRDQVRDLAEVGLFATVLRGSGS